MVESVSLDGGVKQYSMLSSAPKHPLRCCFHTQSYQDILKYYTHRNNMAHRVKRPKLQWVLVPTGEMCLQLGVSSDTIKYWRIAGILPQGLYWVSLPGNSTRILWVRDLVRDWFVNGEGSPAHVRAIEKYRASLPSSSEYKPISA